MLRSTSVRYSIACSEPSRRSCRAGALDRQDAGLLGRIGAAVLALAQSQPGDRQLEAGAHRRRGVARQGAVAQRLAGRGQQLDRGALVALFEFGDRGLATQAPVGAAPGRGEFTAQPLELATAEELVVDLGLGRELPQQFDHAAVLRRMHRWRGDTGVAAAGDRQERTTQNSAERHGSRGGGVPHCRVASRRVTGHSGRHQPGGKQEQAVARRQHVATGDRRAIDVDDHLDALELRLPFAQQSQQPVHGRARRHLEPHRAATGDLLQGRQEGEFDAELAGHRPTDHGRRRGIGHVSAGKPLAIGSPPATIRRWARTRNSCRGCKGSGDEVAATRATWKATGSGADAKPRDKRLDSVLPMQFEHEGALIWSEQAHRASLRSALWELTLYVSGLLGFLLLLAIKWLPAWLYIGLGCLFVLAWVMHRIHRAGERPAQLWREQAEVVPGALVYANKELHAVGPEPASNAGFVFTFDADLAADPERMQTIARRCFELHDPATKATPDERELQRRSVAWSEDRTPDNRTCSIG